MGEGPAEEGSRDDPAGPRKPAGGGRLANIEDETERADQRLRQLERSSGELRDSVDALAEATGELRRQSAAMREAALRVAEAAALAKRKRYRGGPRRQASDRPPRTK